MARRKLTDAEIWQAIGMVRGGMSYIQTAERFNESHSVIVRLKQRLIGVQKNAKGQENFHSTLETRFEADGLSTGALAEVNRRLNNARFCARRPIKRPLLAMRHKTTRFQWELGHMGWNIKLW
jgi:hypothetical protein